MTTTLVAVNQVADVSCIYCGEGHLFDNCPGNPALVNYVGNFNRQNKNNPYSNTYNPGWRQHPKVSQSNQNQNAAASNGQNEPAQPPGFPWKNQGQRNTGND